VNSRAHERDPSQCQYTRPYTRRRLGWGLLGEIEGQHAQEDDHTRRRGRGIESAVGKRRVALTFAPGARGRSPPSPEGREERV
jgi:hypothetical protein